MNIRRQIIRQLTKGKTLIDISEHYHLSYSTVRRICKRFQQEGSPGLLPHYYNCGYGSTSTTPLIHRAAVWLKRLHPRWGAALIRIKLKNCYRRAIIPCERTLQRWFHSAGLYKAKSTFPSQAKPWARHVHDTWQIDAKEKLRLGGRQRACYLSVIDERSGCMLHAFVFPPLSNQ